MKSKHRILLLSSIVLLTNIIWFLFRPVEIVAVHNKDNFSDILVKTFPFTDKEKIEWWLANRAMLKERYNIPKPDKHGVFFVTFWIFGEGYKEDKIDERLCFNDMKTKRRCIEKDAVFTVSRNRYSQTFFSTANGKYRLNSDEKLSKIEEK